MKAFAFILKAGPFVGETWEIPRLGGICLCLSHMLLVLFALFSLSGCAKDRSLAPPPDSEQVTVTVKVPKELVTEELKIIYRSSICTRTVYNVHDEPVELDGTNGTHTQLQQQGDSDLYQAKVAVDGGGECQWRLSNLTFGVAYADPTIFGENVTFGAGGGSL